MSGEPNAQPSYQPSKRWAVRRAAAARARKLRERRRRGVIAVLPFELVDEDLPVLISRGFLRPEQARDRSAQEDAVARAFEEWLGDA